MEYFSWYLVFLLEGTSISTANIMTALIFWRRRSTLKRATYLLVNLALADMLVGLAVISFGSIGVVFNRYFLDTFEAKVFITFLFLGFTSSVCSLAGIAVERAFAITKPMKHRTAPTAYYWRGLSVIWIIAALNSTLMGIRAFLRGRELATLRTVIAFVWLVLLSVICLSYCSMLWTVLKRSPALGQRDLQNRKLAKTLFIVTFFSLATVIPGIIATSMPKNRKEESIDVDAFFALIFIQFSNSLLNPFVYALRMPEFRREFKRLCLAVGCPRSGEEVIPVADAGARGLTLRSVETLVKSASDLHTGICTGVAENNTWSGNLSSCSTISKPHD